MNTTLPRIGPSKAHGLPAVGLLLCIVFSFVTTLHAAPDDVLTTMQSAPLVEGQKLQIVVTAVQGSAQYRRPDMEKWESTQVGQRFDEGVEFRTLAGSLQFLIEPQEFVRIDRYTAIKVLRSNVENGTIKSDIGMKYGKISAFVDVASRPHECRVITPNTVSAVTDTIKSITDEVGRPATIAVLQGSIKAEMRGQAAQVLGKAGRNNIVALKQGRTSAAATALEDRTVDPSIAFARSAGEEKLVQYVLNSGATVGFDRQLNLPVVRGGSVPQADSDLVPILPGVLNFVLRWEGNSDLNLGVNVGTENPRDSEFIYPVQGINKSPTGGRIAFDHRGGPNGGFEVIYWPRDTFKEGNYLPVVVNQQGPASTARLDVFQNGQRVPLTTVDSSGFPSSVDFVTGVVPPRTSKDDRAPFFGSVVITRTGGVVPTVAGNRVSRR